MLAVVSCNKDDATEIIPVQQFQDVVFDITNFVPQDASKDLFVSKDNGDSPNDDYLPNCVDLEPSYVIINISDEEYTLNLVTLNDKTETEVVKLLAGEYTINSFIVYAADGTPIWASPFMGSYYQVLWQLRGVNDFLFTVNEFDKVKVELDVLCYRPFDYERFGFAWFAYAKIEIHTVCFFGDICTKFYDEFHNERSPYFGQEYGGYDFPAIFYINIRNGAGEIVNDNRSTNGIYANSNLSWFGTGSPLCIEYPDIVGVAETFTFEIMLAMPNGDWGLIYTGQFDDTAMAEVGNPDAFGGTDGVFDFVVGNCSYDGNDANLEMLPWIPIPETADMDVVKAPIGQYLINVKFRDGTVLPAPIPSVIEEEIWYNTLCGEEFVPIYEDGYKVEFYSSMDIELPNSNFPAAYINYPWGSMNYIANHCEENVALYGWDYIQEALWYIIDPVNTQRGVNNALAVAATANSGFIPTVGDYACVLIEPISTIPATRAIEGFQLLLLRVDP